MHPQFSVVFCEHLQSSPHLQSAPHLASPVLQVSEIKTMVKLGSTLDFVTRFGDFWFLVITKLTINFASASLWLQNYKSEEMLPRERPQQKSTS